MAPFARQQGLQRASGKCRYNSCSPPRTLQAAGHDTVTAVHNLDAALMDQSVRGNLADMAAALAPVDAAAAATLTSYVQVRAGHSWAEQAALMALVLSSASCPQGGARPCTALLLCSGWGMALHRLAALLADAALWLAGHRLDPRCPGGLHQLWLRPGQHPGQHGGHH